MPARETGLTESAPKVAEGVDEQDKSQKRKKGAVEDNKRPIKRVANGEKREAGEQQEDSAVVKWVTQLPANSLPRRIILFIYWYEPQIPVRIIMSFPQELNVLDVKAHIIPALGHHYDVGQRLECWEPVETRFVPVSTSIVMPLARDTVLLKDGRARGSLEGLGDAISQVERRDEMYQSFGLRFVPEATKKTELNKNSVPVAQPAADLDLKREGGTVNEELKARTGSHAIAIAEQVAEASTNAKSESPTAKENFKADGDGSAGCFGEQVVSIRVQGVNSDKEWRKVDKGKGRAKSTDGNGGTGLHHYQDEEEYWFNLLNPPWQEPKV